MPRYIIEKKITEMFEVEAESLDEAEKKELSDPYRVYVHSKYIYPGDR